MVSGRVNSLSAVEMPILSVEVSPFGAGRGGDVLRLTPTGAVLNHVLGWLAAITHGRLPRIFKANFNAGHCYLFRDCSFDFCKFGNSNTVFNVLKILLGEVESPSWRAFSSP